MSSKLADELVNGKPLITPTTVYSLLSTVAILLTAYLASVRFLPKNSSTKVRIFFIWHAFDGLIHIFLEGSFLYNCFFVYVDAATTAVGTANGASAYLAPGIHFLGQEGRVYGSHYATNPMGALWREYALADARWGGTDLAVVSLELLTVFIGAPFALWVCVCLAKQRADTYYWMSLLAAGELYGGELIAHFAMKRHYAPMDK